MEWPNEMGIKLIRWNFFLGQPDSIPQSWDLGICVYEQRFWSWQQQFSGFCGPQSRFLKYWQILTNIHNSRYLKWSWNLESDTQVSFEIYQKTWRCGWCRQTIAKVTVVLMSINIGLKILLKNLIDLFHLTITLKMVSRVKVQGDLQFLTQCPPKLGNKPHYMIWHKVSQEAMEA